MRMKMLASLLAVAALAIPTAAVAGKGHGGHGGGQKQATYLLKGTLSAYTPAPGSSPGSITILVSKANRAGRPFVGMSLTFPVAATNKLMPTGGTITDGDRGTVQVRGARGVDAATLQTLTPKSIVDEDEGGGGDHAVYELKGTLSAFTPAAGDTPGSVTILVSEANPAGQPFLGLTLTFPVASTTEVEPGGVTIADGDHGEVKVVGPPSLDATALQALAPKEVEDESVGGDH